MTQWASLPVQRIHPSVASLVFSIQAHDCHVAGGYARWACSTRDNTPPPRDIDIICPSKKKLDSLRASFKTNGFTEVRDGQFSITFKSPLHTREIQLLKPFTGESIEECLEKFDLSVCRMALLNHDTAVGDMAGYEDEKLNRVRMSHVDPETAVNTLCRLLRYANKGYEIDKGEVDKVVDVIRSEARRVGAEAERSSFRGSAYDVGS